MSIHDFLEGTCGGTGYLHCFCGGDFCVCGLHGGMDCGGCEDCEVLGELFDDDDCEWGEDEDEVEWLEAGDGI